MDAILLKIQMGDIKLNAYKLISFDKIPSTQDYAHDLIAQRNASDKTVVVANAQSAGRGRYKRTWVSHHGNLYASFIYKIFDQDPKLSYAVAVAVAETLIHFGLNPMIKWPNDILIDGKKISGILIEYVDNFVVVGIGINIKTCPTVKEYKTTKTDNYIKLSVNDVLGVLMKNMDKWRNANFVDVRERWMALAMFLNKNIHYRGKTAEFMGINEDGALVLRTDTRYVLTYGDEINI